MPIPRLLLLVALLGLAPLSVRAQEYKIEPLKDAPPEGVAGEVRDAMADSGFRVTKDGQPFVDLWLRKEIPASRAPGEAKGAILFPFLTEGELLGAIRYYEESYDYRDQVIDPGLYTIRYGLLPVDGDHLGVSPYRDYSLLVLAEEDTKVADLTKRALHRQSADAAATNHPAILMTISAPKGVQAPSVQHDEQEDRWGAVLELPLKVEGGEATSFPIQLILVGVAAV